MKTIIAILTALVISGPAWAQQQMSCGDYEATIEHYTTKREMRIVSTSMAYGVYMYQTLVSPEGVWLSLMTRADGVTCIRAEGTNWESMEPAPMGDPS